MKENDCPVIKCVFNTGYVCRASALFQCNRKKVDSKEEEPAVVSPKIKVVAGGKAKVG